VVPASKHHRAINYLQSKWHLARVDTVVSLFLYFWTTPCPYRGQAQYSLNSITTHKPAGIITNQRILPASFQIPNTGTSTMKYILILTLLLTATAAHAQNGTNPNYDREMAEELGADSYGMKSYYLVILKTGPNTTADADLTRASFRGHLDNINRLADEGKLIVAGPLGENARSYRGIFILNNINSTEEAKSCCLPIRPLRTDCWITKYTAGTDRRHCQRICHTRTKYGSRDREAAPYLLLTQLRPFVFWM